MKIIGILKEHNGDHRVCLLPKDVTHFVKNNDLSVLFEPGLGEGIGISDKEYEEAGGISTSANIIYQNAEAVLSINHQYQGEPCHNDIKLIGIFNLLFHNNRLEYYIQNKQVNAFSLDLLPRTTKAQSMDVLSSMASLAGYRAVIKASELYGSVFPMFTTAAGTLKPAKVLILGAGVAGLQAIATAKRLGAVVEAFDVRKSAGEEVRSLGATFIEVPGFSESSSSGGYAVEQTEEYLKLQKELIHERASTADVIICTANIPGRKAPLLITKETVQSMKRGSVIIDLAAEQGGNCELSPEGNTHVYNGVTIVGDSHLTRENPLAASQLLSTNYKNFLYHLLTNDNEQDPILKPCKVVHRGEIIHPSFEHLLELN